MPVPDTAPETVPETVLPDVAPPSPPGGRLGEDVFAELDRRLAPTDAELLARYPGETAGRQPVHTVYVPADLARADLTREWGRQARAALDEHAPTSEALATATRLKPTAVAAVHARLLDKLDREPVEDLRIDFEDGYGARPHAEEDTAAVAAGKALAEAVATGCAPPFLGVRVKGTEPATRRRGVRTLDLVLGSLLENAPLPAGFVVTLPKVLVVDQVEAMVEVCTRLESVYALPAGRLRFEIQVETPQAVLGADGTATVARMVHAADGRCAGLHYGTYDYSAACGVAAGFQSMEHPVADHAKAVMLLAAAGTGARVSDGSTNVLPVGDRQAVHAGWRLHARLVRRSLERALWQGWDLHPAQLVTRYLATYVFFRDALPAAAARLQSYVQGAGGDGPGGGVLDEPATAQALAAVLVRGLDCGALDEAEVTQRCGVDRGTLDGFARRRVG
jgi:hypothetical protein